MVVVVKQRRVRAGFNKEREAEAAGLRSKMMLARVRLVRAAIEWIASASAWVVGGPHAACAGMAWGRCVLIKHNSHGVVTVSIHEGAEGSRHGDSDAPRG